MTTYTSNATGSGVIGNIEQYALPIEQVQTLPPIITTTTAVTRSADSLSYSDTGANNQTLIVVDGAGVELDAWNGEMDATVLGDDLTGELSSLYVDAQYAEEINTLYVDEVNSVAPLRVEFTLASISAGSSRIPDVLIGPPICNHIPPAGTEIRWGGTTLVLERKDG
jgi:hypothetical protein